MNRLLALPCVLLGILLLFASTVLAGGNLQSLQVDCDPPTFSGVRHCVGADGRAHSIVIDLSNPLIRFQTVLPVNASGEECNSVNPSTIDPGSNCPFPYPLERLENMLGRYVTRGAVAIINTDYFGCGDSKSEYPCGSSAGYHGAQGLTVRNGERLDGVEHGVTTFLAVQQPSTAISPSNIVRIVRPESRGQIMAHLKSLYYNSVSGAPLIVIDGKIPDNITNGACGPTPEYPGAAVCRRNSQSAIALTNDGLLVLITAQMDASTLAAHLITQYGAHTAMKFDGGGSARIAWVDGKGAIQQFGATTENRPVAGGLLVFSAQDTKAPEQPVTPTSPMQKFAIDGFGMGSSVHLRVGSTQLEQALDEMRTWHIGWAREEIPWSEVEPKPDRFRWRYDFGDTPRDFSVLFAQLKDRSIQPLVVLDYGPSYIPGPVPDDDLVTRWRNYVQRVVDEFGKDVDHWEIGNEVNSRQFWGKVVYPNETMHLAETNPDLYARMLRTAYEVIKQHDPRDAVILGGLVGFTDGDCETSPFEYLRRLYAAGAWDAFDAIAIHPYWGANPPEAFIARGPAYDPVRKMCLTNKTAVYNLIGEVRAIRDFAASFGPKSIWVTEVGWDRSASNIRAQEPQTRPEIVESDYLVRTYVPLLAEPGVEKVFWYTQRDDPNIPGFALQPTGQRALTHIASLLTGSRPLGQFRGQQDHGNAQDDDVYEYRFERNGQLIIVAWKARGGDKPRTVTLNDLDVPRLWMYPVDAATLAPEQGQELVVSNARVSIELTERPVLLISQELSWWERLWQVPSQRIKNWWQKQRHKAVVWWQKQQSAIAEELEKWWRQQWTKLREQMEQWRRNLERQVAQELQRQLEEYLNSLCGISLLPAGFIAALWISVVWSHKKCQKDTTQNE